MPGLLLIPYGLRKAELLAADTHLAEARCQKTGTASWVLFFEGRTVFPKEPSFFMPNFIYSISLHKEENMRKILAGIIIVFLFCGCAAEKNGKVIVENEAKQEMQYEYGENMTVTRALAAKMVCLLFLEQKKCKENHFYDRS